MTYGKYKEAALAAKNGKELLTILQRYPEYIPDTDITDYFNMLVRQETGSDYEYHEEVF